MQRIWSDSLVILAQQKLIWFDLKQAKQNQIYTPVQILWGDLFDVNSIDACCYFC